VLHYICKYFKNKTKKKNNVYLSRSLKSDRDPVDEIAAVYFIMPTKDNISRIGKVNILKKQILIIYLFENIGFS
jgi:hypothetical protein